MNPTKTHTIEVELSEEEIDALESLNLVTRHASIAIQKISEAFAEIELEEKEQSE